MITLGSMFKKAKKFSVTSTGGWLRAVC